MPMKDGKWHPSTPETSTVKEFIEIRDILNHRFRCNMLRYCNPQSTEDYCIITECPHWKLVKRSALLEAKLDAVKALPEKWSKESSEYPNSPEGLYTSIAVRCCAKEIEEALNKCGEL